MGGAKCTPFRSLNSLNLILLDMEEHGVRLKLTIVETAGFGDHFDKDKRLRVFINFVFPFFFKQCW